MVRLDISSSNFNPCILRVLILIDIALKGENRSAVVQSQCLSMCAVARGADARTGHPHVEHRHVPLCCVVHHKLASEIVVWCAIWRCLPCSWLQSALAHSANEVAVPTNICSGCFLP